MTKNHFEFDLETYKEQQNGKVYHLFLTPNLYIRLKDLDYNFFKEEHFCNKYEHIGPLLNYYHRMEYCNQDMYQRGGLYQVCELSRMPLTDATWQSYG